MKVICRANRKNLKSMLSYREELYNQYIRFLCISFKHNLNDYRFSSANLSEIDLNSLSLTNPSFDEAGQTNEAERRSSNSFVVYCVNRSFLRRYLPFNHYSVLTLQ